MSQSVGAGSPSSPGLQASAVSHAAVPGTPGQLAFDPMTLPILVVDDEPDNLDAFRFSFRKSFNILTAQSGTEGLAILQREKVAVVITDQRMPRMTGLEFLARARALSPDVVPIIVTAYTDVEVLVEAVNMGQIYRYIVKPWDGKEMRGVLTQALERFHLRAENQRLVEQLRHYAGYLDQEWHSAFNFGQLVGDSPTLQAALSRAEQAAATRQSLDRIEAKLERRHDG